jgi:hypothetical protein
MILQRCSPQLVPMAPEMLIRAGHPKMKRAPGRGAERPRGLCACAGFRRCAGGMAIRAGSSHFKWRPVLKVPATLQSRSTTYNGS